VNGHRTRVRQADETRNAQAPRPCPPGDQTDDEKVPQLAPVPNPSKALRVAYRTEEEIHNNLFRIPSTEEAKR